MPCNSDYMRRDALEEESALVLTLLTEVGLHTESFNKYYGDAQNLDRDVASLCQWCKQNKDKLNQYSLELQIWWRDHQIADQRREEKEREEDKLRKIKAMALSKLTEEEKRVLGV